MQRKLYLLFKVSLNRVNDGLWVIPFQLACAHSVQQLDYSWAVGSDLHSCSFSQLQVLSLNSCLNLNPLLPRVHWSFITRRFPWPLLVIRSAGTSPGLSPVNSLALDGSACFTHGPTRGIRIWGPDTDPLGHLHLLRPLPLHRIPGPSISSSTGNPAPVSLLSLGMAQILSIVRDQVALGCATRGVVSPLGDGWSDAGHVVPNLNPCRPLDPASRPPTARQWRLQPPPVLGIGPSVSSSAGAPPGKSVSTRLHDHSMLCVLIMTHIWAFWLDSGRGIPDCTWCRCPRTAHGHTLEQLPPQLVPWALCIELVLCILYSH